MSRYKKDEMCVYDIEWYGIDNLGNIAVFCSAGYADVPEFVCGNKERAEKLVDFFDIMPHITDCKLHFIPCSKTLSKEVAENYSKKGLFYFDSDDNSKSDKGICTLQLFYTKQSSPENPLKFKDLPENIQKLLRYNFMNIENFEETYIIRL